MAATNKCLAEINKSRTGHEATNRRSQIKVEKSKFTLPYDTTIYEDFNCKPGKTSSEWVVVHASGFVTEGSRHCEFNSVTPVGRKYKVKMHCQDGTDGPSANLVVNMYVDYLGPTRSANVKWKQLIIENW